MPSILYSKKLWEVSGLPVIVAFPVIRKGNTLFCEHVNVEQDMPAQTLECVLAEENAPDLELNVQWDGSEADTFGGTLEIINGFPTARSKKRKPRKRV
jgi:hypothetical protein